MNNRTSSAKSALYGTKTSENLKNAFEKEAENFARGSIFASLAQQSGDMSAKRAFLEQSDNDLRHAELWLGYLDELGDTIENISALSGAKTAMGTDLYPFMADIADEEGFPEIAEKMRLAGDVKSTQSRELESEGERISTPDSLYSESPETIWHCRSCGYNISGNMPPERCPLCSYPDDFFSKG